MCSNRILHRVPRRLLSNRRANQRSKVLTGTPMTYTSSVYSGCEAGVDMSHMQGVKVCPAKCAPISLHLVLGTFTVVI